jgi:hypothetical protein
MDIEIWFDEIDEEDEIEYPLMCSTDNIWTPPENKN